MIKIDVVKSVTLSEIPNRTRNAHSGQVTTLSVGVYRIAGFREFPPFQAGGNSWFGVMLIDENANEYSVSFGDMRGVSTTYVDGIRKEFTVSKQLFKNLEDIDKYMSLYSHIKVDGFENLSHTRYGDETLRTKRVPIFSVVKNEQKETDAPF